MLNRHLRRSLLDANARENVLIDHEFADMIDDSSELFEFDLTKLHDVHRPLAADS